MISHKDERMMEIVRKTGMTGIFPAARYIMQLEDVKEQAGILVNRLAAVEFPFKYTGTDRPVETVYGAKYLARAVAEEQMQAEERLREMLVRFFKGSGEMQKEVFGECYKVNYYDAYKIIKDLKMNFGLDPMEESDEEILEKILFVIDIDYWLDHIHEEFKSYNESDDGEDIEEKDEKTCSL